MENNHLKYFPRGKAFFPTFLPTRYMSINQQILFFLGGGHFAQRRRPWTPFTRLHFPNNWLKYKWIYLKLLVVVVDDGCSRAPKADERDALHAQIQINIIAVLYIWVGFHLPWCLLPAPPRARRRRRRTGRTRCSRAGTWVFLNNIFAKIQNIIFFFCKINIFVETLERARPRARSLYEWIR